MTSGNVWLVKKITSFYYMLDSLTIQYMGHSMAHNMVTRQISHHSALRWFHVLRPYLRMYFCKLLWESSSSWLQIWSSQVRDKLTNSWIFVNLHGEFSHLLWKHFIFFNSILHGLIYLKFQRMYKRSSLKTSAYSYSVEGTAQLLAT